MGKYIHPAVITEMNERITAMLTGVRITVVKVEELPSTYRERRKKNFSPRYAVWVKATIVNEKGEDMIRYSDEIQIGHHGSVIVQIPKKGIINDPF
jgi:hypothetical protein